LYVLSLIFFLASLVSVLTVVSDGCTLTVSSAGGGRFGVEESVGGGKCGGEEPGGGGGAKKLSSVMSV
jgi:hypothetical protein